MMTQLQEAILAWLNARVAEKCGYIMGASGQMCSRAFREKQAAQYASYGGNPSYGKDTIIKIGARWDGHKVYDCQGLVRKAYEAVGIVIKSGATTQYNDAKTRYSTVGLVKDMPTGGIVGAQVWRRSQTNAAVMNHTAVCVGDGAVIEAKGTSSGVMKSSGLASYQFYGVPQGLLSTDAQVPIFDNEIKTQDVASAGNEATTGIVAHGGVRMRTISGAYILTIPEGAIIEVTEYRTANGVRQGKTSFSASTGLYSGNIYVGWVDMTFVHVDAVGESLAPLDSATVDYTIWEFLKTKGCHPSAIAGIMGNLYVESALIPGNLQNSGNRKLGMTDAEYTNAVDSGTYTKFDSDGFGYGLCQWTSSGRKKKLLLAATVAAVSIADLELQLTFMWAEIQSIKSLSTMLNDSYMSLREVSDAFMCKFERPADQSEANKASRASHGQRYYDKYVR